MFINVSLSILLKLISLESVGIAFRSGENHNYSAFFGRKEQSDMGYKRLALC